MPGHQTRNVESLFEICSKAVANHLAEAYDKMTASNHNEEDGKSESNSSVVNAFNEWPLLLLERVIGVLRMNDLLNVKHRDLLLNRHTRKLDFSSICTLESYNMVVSFLQLAVVRCPQLTDLVISNLRSHYTVEDYTKFLPHFKHLQVLNVAYNCERFDNKCLEILGVHCSDLRELNVGFCHVTDIGIHLLCGGPSKLTGKNIPMRLNELCKSLEELKIVGTEITAYGAAMALQRLPHLQILAYERIAEAFVIIHLTNDHADSAHSEFALTQLDLLGEWVVSPSCVAYQTRSLRPAISLCPFITHLDIHIAVGVTDGDLLPITALERLSVFKIWNICRRDLCRITFDGSLAPILKTRGKSLNTLHLVQFSTTFICLATVIEYCLNLEHLTLSNRKPPRLMDRLVLGSRIDKRVNSDCEWKRLKKLTLRYCDIMAEVFLLILISSPALQDLTISESSTLTDDVLQHVFQCNSFKNLEMLSLDACPYVSERGVNLFRTNENICLKVKNCGNLVEKG